MNEHQRVSILFKKYLERTASEDEKQDFLNFVNDPAYTPFIKQLITAEYEDQEDPIGLSDAGKNRVLQHIFKENEIAVPLIKRVSIWPRIAAAASIILALSIGSYFILYKPAGQKTVQSTAHDVAPGHQHATLTLANGEKIVLIKGMNGQLAHQNQTTINANENTIIYQPDKKSADQDVYNTLSTSVGEQSPYPLVLADGTKVWLNAASSITFPVAFNGKERVVKITGEAYFEVMHNNHQSFRVQSPTQTVEDIGTHFNINSYANEPTVKTTLIEGAVRVRANNPANTKNNNIELKPGQQAQLTNDEFKVEKVNTTRITAWKDGNFRFQNDDIQTIMRQLARWYNIEVHYQGLPPTDKFSGRISRKSPISAVLQMMELTNHVHFKIEGRRITVIQ